jgi:hypothetical protein
MKRRIYQDSSIQCQSSKRCGPVSYTEKVALPWLSPWTGVIFGQPWTSQWGHFPTKSMQLQGCNSVDVQNSWNSQSLLPQRISVAFGDNDITAILQDVAVLQFLLLLFYCYSITSDYTLMQPHDLVLNVHHDPSSMCNSYKHHIVGKTKTNAGWQYQSFSERSIVNETTSVAGANIMYLNPTASDVLKHIIWVSLPSCRIFQQGIHRYPAMLAVIMTAEDLKWYYFEAYWMLAHVCNLWSIIE